jgi:hypothetical protein
MTTSASVALGKLLGWERDAPGRKDAIILLATLALGAGLGVVQVMALNSIPVLLPLGVLAAAAYLLLVLSRSLAALVIFVMTFAEFWGVLPEVTELGGVKFIDVVTAILVVPIAVSLAKTGFPFRGRPARSLRLGAVILLFLIVGEVFLTTVRTDQSFWLSVKAAKPYLYYFGFLLVPAYAGSVQGIRRLAAWMTAIAAALSLAYLLISLIGEISALPGLIVGEANYVGLGTFTRVRSNGAPLIVAMLLYQFYRFADGRSSRIEKTALVLLTMGATVHFYRSLWVGILVGVIVQGGIEGRRGVRSVAKFLIFLVALAIAIGAIHPEYGQLIASRALSTVTEVEQLNGSYGARQEQIERWAPILREHWLLGIGFLHHDSAVGQQLEAMHQLEGTGNYDIGWVDLLGRLGVLGIGLLGLGLQRLSSSCWLRHAYDSDAEVAIYRRTLLAYLVAGVVSLPGYPILSCGAGIIPMALLIGMLGVMETEEESPRETAAQESSAVEAARAIPGETF